MKVQRWLVFISQRLKLPERMPWLKNRVYPLAIQHFGYKASVHGTHQFFGQCTVVSFGSAGSACLLAYGLQDVSVAWVGLLCAGLTPFLLLRDLSMKVRRRKQRILMDLPVLLTHLMLLINAGETVQQAVLHCSKENRSSALFQELRAVAQEISNHRSFSVAMEHFNQRCGVQEVARMTATIMMNYKRGGEEFVQALHELSVDLWEARKTAAKRLGEEASSKMVFPMVLIFIVIMIIVATPAIMFMNN